MESPCSVILGTTLYRRSGPSRLFLGPKPRFDDGRWGKISFVLPSQRRHFSRQPFPEKSVTQSVSACLGTRVVSTVSPGVDARPGLVLLYDRAFNALLRVQ